MNNISYVALGLIALMVAGLINENGDAIVTAVPIALFGMSSIVKGLTGSDGKAKTSGTAVYTPPPARPRLEDALADMPFAEEVDDTPPAAGSRKIPARGGKPAPKATGTPARSPAANGGVVALSSAKYLDGGPTNFRKGTTVDTGLGACDVNENP